MEPVVAVAVEVAQQLRKLALEFAPESVWVVQLGAEEQSAVAAGRTKAFGSLSGDEGWFAE